MYCWQFFILKFQKINDFKEYQKGLNELEREERIQRYLLFQMMGEAIIKTWPTRFQYGFNPISVRVQPYLNPNQVKSSWVAPWLELTSCNSGWAQSEPDLLFVWVELGQTFNPVQPAQVALLPITCGTLYYIFQYLILLVVLPHRILCWYFMVYRISYLFL